MWSYPVVADGLIYVVDLRNGLYVLRYTGPGADDVAEISFLEGNSNLGDALRFDPITDTASTVPVRDARPWSLAAGALGLVALTGVRRRALHHP